MKIGLIVDTIDFGYSGAGTYAYNLAKHLLEIDKENEYNLIHNERSRCADEFKDIFDKGTEVTIKPPFGFKNKRAIESLITKRKYPKILKDMDLDIVHETRGDDFLAPPNKLFDCESKLIITIHDTYNFFQNFQIKHLKSYFYGHIVSRRLKKLLTSDKNFHIIAVSQFIKDNLLDRFSNLKEEKIHVIHHGIDKSIFKPKEVLSNIPFPFIMYTGGIHPKRNIPGLIKAFYKVKEEGFPHKLLMVSHRNPRTDKLIEQLNLTREVIFKSDLSIEYLVELYNSTDLFVFPSVHEGFGFPPLEAMASGCPVVASTTGAVSEVVRDAGIKIDPYKIDDLAEAMKKVLLDERLREEMSKKSLKRAKMFSWEKTARETLEVYRKVTET